MVALTLGEAAAILDPPIEAWRLALIIRALSWQPTGTRHTGHPGRPLPTYDMQAIMTLHADIVKHIKRQP